MCLKTNESHSVCLYFMGCMQKSTCTSEIYWSQLSCRRSYLIYILLEWHIDFALRSLLLDHGRRPRTGSRRRPYCKGHLYNPVLLKSWQSEAMQKNYISEFTAWLVLPIPLILLRLFGFADKNRIMGNTE